MLNVPQKRLKQRIYASRMKRNLGKVALAGLLVVGITEYLMGENDWKGGTRQLRKVAVEVANDSIDKTKPLQK